MKPKVKRLKTCINFVINALERHGDALFSRTVAEVRTLDEAKEAIDSERGNTPFQLEIAGKVSKEYIH
jgi:hypothetical protein